MSENKANPLRFLSKLRGGGKDKSQCTAAGDVVHNWRDARQHQLRVCPTTIVRELKSDQAVMAMGLHQVSDVDVISEEGHGVDSHFLRRFAQACLSLRSELALGKQTLLVALECLAPLTALVSFLVSSTPMLSNDLIMNESDWYEVQARLGVVRSKSRTSASRVHFFTTCTTSDASFIRSDADAIACLGAMLMITKSVTVVSLPTMLVVGQNASSSTTPSRGGALDVRLLGAVQYLTLIDCTVETVVGKCSPSELHLVDSTLLSTVVTGTGGDGTTKEGQQAPRSSSWVSVGGSLRGLKLEGCTISVNELSPLSQTLSSLHLYSCKITGPDNVFALSKVHNEMSHNAWLRLVDISVTNSHVAVLHPSVQLSVSLVRLNLSSNAIEELHPELSHCVALREVCLRHNKLFDVTDISTALTNVTVLDLSHNHIVSVWALAELEHLQSLDISSNRLRFWSDLGHLSRRCLNIRRIAYKDNPLCSPQIIFANDINKLGIALFQKPDSTTRYGTATTTGPFAAPSTSSAYFTSESSLSPLRRNVSDLCSQTRSPMLALSSASSLVSVNGVTREMSPKEANSLLAKYDGLLAVNDGVLTSLDVLEDVRVERQEASKTPPAARPPLQATEILRSPLLEHRVVSAPPLVGGGLPPSQASTDHNTGGGSNSPEEAVGGATVHTTVTTHTLVGGDESSQKDKRVTVVKKVVKTKKKKMGRPVTLNELPRDFSEVPALSTTNSSQPYHSLPPSVPLLSTRSITDEYVDPVTGDRPDLTWLSTKYGNTQGLQRYTELTDELIDRGPLNQLLQGTLPERARPTDTNSNISSTPQMHVTTSDGTIGGIEEGDAGLPVEAAAAVETGKDEELVSRPLDSLGMALVTFLDGTMLPFLREATVHHESPGVTMHVFPVAHANTSDWLHNNHHHPADGEEVDTQEYFTAGASFSTMAGVSGETLRSVQLAQGELNPLALLRGGNVWETEMDSSPSSGGGSVPQEVWLSSREMASTLFSVSETGPDCEPTPKAVVDAPTGKRIILDPFNAASEAAMIETSYMDPDTGVAGEVPITTTTSAPCVEMVVTSSRSRYAGMVLIRVDRFESDYQVGFALRSKAMSEDEDGFQRPVLTSMHYCPWARGKSDSVVRATNVKVVPAAEGGRSAKRSAFNTALESGITALSRKDSTLTGGGGDNSTASIVWGGEADCGDDGVPLRVPQVLMTEAQVAESSAAHSVPTPSLMVVGFVVEPHLAKAVVRCLIRKLHAYRDPNYVSQHLDWPLYTSGVDESDLKLPRYRGCARSDDGDVHAAACGMLFRGIRPSDYVGREHPPAAIAERGTIPPPIDGPLGTGIFPIDASQDDLFMEDPWCIAQREVWVSTGTFDIPEPPSTRLSVPIVLAPRRLAFGLLCLMYQVSSKALTESVGMSRPGVEFRIHPDEIGIHVRTVLMPSGANNLHMDPSSTSSPTTMRDGRLHEVKFAFCNAVISSTSIDGIRDDEEFAAFVVVLRDTICVFRDLNYRGSAITNADDLFEPILTYSVADLELVSIGYGYTHLVLNFGAGTSEMILFFREISSLALVVTYLRDVCLVTTVFAVLPLPDQCYEQVSTMTGCRWDPPGLKQNGEKEVEEGSTDPSSLSVVGYSMCFVAQLSYSFDATGLQVLAPPSSASGGAKTTSTKGGGNTERMDRSMIVTRSEGGGLSRSKGLLREASSMSRLSCKYQPRPSHLAGGGADVIEDDFIVLESEGGCPDSEVRRGGVHCDVESTFPLRHFPRISSVILPSGWERCSVIFSKPRFHVSIIQEDHLSWARNLRGEGRSDYTSPIASFPVDDIIKVEVSPRLANLPLLAVVHVDTRKGYTKGVGGAEDDGCDRFLLCFQHLRQIDQFITDLKSFHRACSSYKETFERVEMEKATASTSPRVRKQLISAASVLFDNVCEDADGFCPKKKAQSMMKQRRLAVVQLEAEPSAELGAIGPCELMLAALGRK